MYCYKTHTYIHIHTHICTCIGLTLVYYKIVQKAKLQYVTYLEWILIVCTTLKVPEFFNRIHCIKFNFKILAQFKTI